MRPHHSCEEVHPGRWKVMESNNNGEQHRRCTINWRKEVLWSERKIRRIVGRSKQGSNHALSSREELAQYTTSTWIRTTSLATIRKGMRAKTLNRKKGKSRRSREQQTLKGAITLHHHEREELQNKRSTKGKSFKTSALLKRSTPKRTKYPKARRNQKTNERANARSSWRNGEQREGPLNEG